MLIQEIRKYLQDWFDYPNSKIFCQIATIAENNQPHIRTMDLYHMTEEGYVILLTKTSSRKWHVISVRL